MLRGCERLQQTTNIRYAIVMWHCTAWRVNCVAATRNSSRGSSNPNICIVLWCCIDCIWSWGVACCKFEYHRVLQVAVQYCCMHAQLYALMQRIVKDLPYLQIWAIKLYCLLLEIAGTFIVTTNEVVDVEILGSCS